MKRIETSIIINASARQVWLQFTNFKSYPEWNPFIRSIKGELKAGNTITVELKPKDQKGMTFTPVVLAAEENREFRWKGKLFAKGLFDGEHFFRIEPLGDNQVKFIHGEQFTGLLVAPLLAMVGNSTKAGFEAMNKALKERAEAIASVEA